MASKIEVEVELKSNAEKFWESVKETTTLFPKAFPQEYQAIEVIEGDGKSAGSVRVIKYTPGQSEITSTTEKIELVDEEKKTLIYSVIDGDLKNYYTNFKASLTVSPKGDGGSVKWCCEFDKASEEVPNPDLIKDFVVKIFKDLDAYITG